LQKINGTQIHQFCRLARAGMPQRNGQNRFRAMCGGLLAAYMTASLAGFLL
jgi:nucleoside permease NupC